MQVLASLRPFALAGRIFMWAGIFLFLAVGLFSNSPAWAETTACPGQSSIPVAPITLFLKYGGPASTYQISLCEDPAQPVDITTSLSTDQITVDPMSFTLNSTVTQTVSVAITSTHPADVPFTAIITHSAASDDPEFDHGSLNVSQVTAYYSPPVAVDDSASALHGQSIEINVLANDIDTAGQGITLPANTVVTQPTNGSASFTISQTIEYTPTAGFFGIDTFTYRIEDGIGNSDTATVTMNVAEPGVTNPQIEEVDPEAGAEVIFETPQGPIEVTIPPLLGLSPSDIVVLTFGEVVTPTGNIDAPPDNVGSFSGLSFNIELFVNGEPVQPGQLSAPLTISFPLPDEFVEGLDGRRIIIAVWDGTSWVTTGVEIEGLTETPAQLASTPNAVNETSLTITTTVFGEFAIFVVDVLFLPTLERTQ